MIDTGMLGARAPRALHYRVEQFLYDEAAMLDSRRYRDWLALLHERIRYRMPVSVTAGRDGAGGLRAMDHFDEDRYALTKRVERLETSHAWTEDPPSRTRRHVSNIRVCSPSPDGSVAVESYLLLFRSRGDQRAPQTLSDARVDLLVAADASFRIVERHITVDESVLRMQNLAVFL